MSLVACLGPIQEIGVNIKHPATVTRPQTLEIPSFWILVNPKLVWNSWNLACYLRAAPTCCGKNFVPFGVGLGISFSQTRTSQNKRDGCGREHATFGDKTISVASYCFQKNLSVNIEQHGCCVQFWNRGSFEHFYTLTRVPRHFMRIIQIWTTCTCSSAYKHIEKSNMCPWLHA